MKKIRSSFAPKWTNDSGRLCAGACGSIHERNSTPYAYLATMAFVSEMPQGSGTALMDRPLKFLHE